MPGLSHPVLPSILCAMAFLAGCAPTAGEVPAPDLDAVGRAVEDLRQTYGSDYSVDAGHLALLRQAREALSNASVAGDDDAEARRQEQAARARAALLANPLLRFDRLLFVRRGVGQLGLPQNWESNSSLPLSGFDN
ncbi:MAG TPA: hypothetical protein PLC40_03935, partial [Candidatus Hydrogenedentes bacterium]|nr:hypothetical protein [Candidatus Hydrogenedentota bacterium]